MTHGVRLLVNSKCNYKEVKLSGSHSDGHFKINQFQLQRTEKKNFRIIGNLYHKGLGQFRSTILNLSDAGTL